MADDWRVTVTLGAGADIGRALVALREHQVEEDVRARLGNRIAVSADGERVRLYADTERAAREAQQVAAAALAAHDIEGAESHLDRWHPAEERWEDATTATPDGDHEEHARLEKDEAAESQATGIAQWELRIEFASHHDARAFETRLGREGFRHLVRRWRYLLVGTDNRDDAVAWAERLKGELPEGATIQVEPGSGVAWQFVPRNGFAVFGGLGV